MASIVSTTKNSLDEFVRNNCKEPGVVIVQNICSNILEENKPMVATTLEKNNLSNLKRSYLNLEERLNQLKEEIEKLKETTEKVVRESTEKPSDPLYLALKNSLLVYSFTSLATLPYVFGSTINRPLDIALKAAYTVTITGVTMFMISEHNYEKFKLEIFEKKEKTTSEKKDKKTRLKEYVRNLDTKLCSLFGGLLGYKFFYHITPASSSEYFKTLASLAMGISIGLALDLYFSKKENKY